MLLQLIKSCLAIVFRKARFLTSNVFHYCGNFFEGNGSICCFGDLVWKAIME